MPSWTLLAPLYVRVMHSDHSVYAKLDTPCPAMQGLYIIMLCLMYIELDTPWSAMHAGSIRAGATVRLVWPWPYRF